MGKLMFTDANNNTITREQFLVGLREHLRAQGMSDAEASVEITRRANELAQFLRKKLAEIRKLKGSEGGNQ